MGQILISHQWKFCMGSNFPPCHKKTVPHSTILLDISESSRKEWLQNETESKLGVIKLFRLGIFIFSTWILPKTAHDKRTLSFSRLKQNFLSILQICWELSETLVN